MRGEEKEGQEGSLQDVGKARRVFPGGRGACAGFCREVIIGFSEVGSG